MAFCRLCFPVLFDLEKDNSVRKYLTAFGMTLLTFCDILSSIRLSFDAAMSHIENVTREPYEDECGF